MFTIRIGGIEVTCESAADAAALIAALGERGATRLLPDAAAGRAADTGSGPPSIAPPARARVAAPAPKTGGQSPWSRGRRPTGTDDELRAVHARLLKGERIDELAAEKDAPASRLTQAFTRAGLSRRFARPNAATPNKSESRSSTQSEIPVRRLPPGASGVEDEKGSYRKAG